MAQDLLFAEREKLSRYRTAVARAHWRTLHRRARIIRRQRASQELEYRLHVLGRWEDDGSEDGYYVEGLGPVPAEHLVPPPVFDAAMRGARESGDALRRRRERVLP